MELGEILDRYFADNDIVLADGFALSDKPRIIIAESSEDIEIFKRGCEVVAVVGKAGLGINDINSIVEKILDYSKR